ncbi:hypothetical protein J2129_000361 [Methanofollis sp. W23]|nr:hypothetical protein [Methanofollis sp. W23]
MKFKVVKEWGSRLYPHPLRDRDLLIGLCARIFRPRLLGEFISRLSDLSLAEDSDGLWLE